MNLLCVDSIVGLVINTLTIGMNLSTNECIESMLRRLKLQVMEMTHYYYTPLARIQTWSNIPHGESLFENIFVFENYPVDESAMKEDLGFELEVVGSVEKTEYPLTLVI